MNGFAAVVRRELSEKRLVFVGAAFVSLLPILAASGPFGETPASEVRAAAAQVFAGAFTFFAALFAAVTAFSSELAQRRFSFYLATPTTTGALFGGKVMAAVLLTALSFAIVILPTSIFQGAAERSEKDMFLGLAAVLFIPILIYGSIVLRARTWWLVLDIAGSAGLAAFIVWFASQPERTVGVRLGENFLPLALPVVLFAVVLVPGIATLAGLLHGRASIQRWHSAAAITLWTLFALSCLGAAGGVLWLRSRPLDSFDVVSTGNATAQGRWAVITGFGPWRLNQQRWFLMDDRERTVSVGSHSAVVSRDGSRAAWLAPSGDGGSTSLFVESPDGGADAVQIGAVPERAWQISISDSGSRVAVASPTTLSLFDSATGRMLAASTHSCSVRRRFFFDTEDSVRIYCQDSDHLTIFELNVPDRRFQLAGTMPLSKDAWIHVDSSGERMLAFTPSRPEQKRSTSILDARTGEVLANILSLARAPRFLTDGKIAAFQESREQLSLTIFSPAGEPERLIALGRGRFARSGMQPSPGHLWVTVFEGEERGRLLLIDLEAGRVIREISRPLNPLFAYHAYSGDDPRALTAPEFANVFLDGGAMVRVDPGTGGITRLLGTRP